MAQETKNKKHFFKDFKSELKKVIWPTPKQLVNSTIAVIVIVLLTSAIVFVLDVVFDLMNNYGINRIKSAVQNETVNVVEANQIEETTAEAEVNQVEAVVEKAE